MRNKKLLIIIGTIVLIIIVVAVIILVTNNNNKPQESGDINNIISTTTKGKLQAYISNLSDNYYIKYNGKFKNTLGEYVSAIVEFTKDGQNSAFRSTELNMHLIIDKEKIYSLSHRYQLIVETDKKNIDTREYNLASDVGQVFVKSYIESVGNIQYDVEEYMLNGTMLKYYFKDNDIKLIRYAGQDIRIIRIEKQTNSELLKKPDWYKTQNI